MWKYYNAGPLTDDHLPLSTLLALSLFSYMTGAGGNCGLSAAMNSTAKSFPDHMRATTVGVVLSGFGLSAFFFGTLSNWLFPGDTSSFLLFLALGTSLPVIVGFLTIRPVPPHFQPDHGERPNNGGLTTLNDPNLNSSSHLLGDPDHGDDDAEASYADVEAVAAYPEAVSAIEITHSTERRRSVELTSSRSPSTHHRNSFTSSKHTIPSFESIDMHGRKLFTGWEFWLLFTILTLCK